jgi:hypothetical protein
MGHVQEQLDERNKQLFMLRWHHLLADAMKKWAARATKENPHRSTIKP